MISFLVCVFMLSLCYGGSYIATCGIIKLICMCFELTFTWKIATGIWLILVILRSIFTVTVNNKK